MILLAKFTLPFGKKLSDFVYHFITLKGENNIQWFGSTQGHGKEYCFYVMLLSAVIFAIIYYFGIAAKVRSATKDNYKAMFFTGYITMVIFSGIIMAVFVSPASVWTLPMLEICLWNILYYTLVFWGCSMLFKGASKAENIHLGTCWK